MSPGSGIGVSDLADHCGHLAWVADALFVLEGRWAGSMESPSAVEHLATHSRLHGWHASLWHDLLPDSPALDAKARRVAPPGWESAVGKAAELGDDSDDGTRLALLYRGLVAREAAMVGDLGRATTGPGDAAAARVVRLVSADLQSDMVGGIGLLVTALGDEASVRRAGDALKALDQSFTYL
jgi:hypothetical protein